MVFDLRPSWWLVIGEFPDDKACASAILAAAAGGSLSDIGRPQR